MVLEGSRSGWIQNRAWYKSICTRAIQARAMVTGTWLVLEDLSLVQFELYQGTGWNPPSPWILKPQLSPCVVCWKPILKAAVAVAVEGIAQASKKQGLIRRETKAPRGDGVLSEIALIRGTWPVAEKRKTVASDSPTRASIHHLASRLRAAVDGASSLSSGTVHSAPKDGCRMGSCCMGARVPREIERPRCDTKGGRVGFIENTARRHKQSGGR